MKKYVCFLWVLFILFTFGGCNQKENDVPENFIRALNSNKEFLKEYPDYSTVTFIKLETFPECFIGSIRKLHIMDSLIFIQNLQGGEDAIFVFNQDGKFITQIGNKGKGPQEYLRINTSM